MRRAGHRSRRNVIFLLFSFDCILAAPRRMAAGCRFFRCRPGRDFDLFPPSIIPRHSPLGCDKKQADVLQRLPAFSCSFLPPLFPSRSNFKHFHKERPDHPASVPSWRPHTESSGFRPKATSRLHPERKHKIRCPQAGNRRTLPSMIRRHRS